MSSPPRRSLQTRGRNRPARNALHPPRGAQSAVACRALSGAPAPARARQSGLPRGPRAGRADRVRSLRWPEPGSGAAPSPRHPASPTRRPPPPLASPPPVGDRVPRRRRRPRGGPLAHRGPRSTTLHSTRIIQRSYESGRIRFRFSKPNQTLTTLTTKGVHSVLPPTPSTYVQYPGLQGGDALGDA